MGSFQSLELDTLDVMTSGPLPPNPAELLQTPAFRMAMERMLVDYDRVIFDSPPVVPVTDPQIIGRQVDGVVLVVRMEQTQREVFKRGLELLRNVKVNLLGVVSNDMNATSGAYGYHYYYQYHQDADERRLPVEREGSAEAPLNMEDRFGR